MKESMSKKIKIYLSNTLNKGEKEEFNPIDENHIKMYVCGPTVYDRPHLGNARSAVVYDILYRLLRSIYPKVTYSRNITDIDDKIIDAANKKNLSINEIAKKYTEFYHADIGALHCLKPDYEPKATEHVENMITMIQILIDKGYAYVSERHVLFSIKKYKNYGKLSNKTTKSLIAGARVEVESYKKDPGDFVLWKPVSVDVKNNEGFESPWGYGRPGWHIECSAMSKVLLGDMFDIHGGGADLKFPHHENEIAQSCAANDSEKMANYWVHNGFLTVAGEKMSKSLNNFTTVRDVLDKGVKGAVIRLFYLTTHYKKPIDFSEKALLDAEKAYNKFLNIVLEVAKNDKDRLLNLDLDILNEEAILCLADDLNTPKVLALAHDAASKKDLGKLCSILFLLGLDIRKHSLEIIDFADKTNDYNAIKGITTGLQKIPEEVELLAKKRINAKKNKNWKEADLLRDKIAEMGYLIKDLPDNKYEICKK